MFSAQQAHLLMLPARRPGICGGGDSSAMLRSLDHVPDESDGRHSIALSDREIEPTSSRDLSFEVRHDVFSLEQWASYAFPKLDRWCCFHSLRPARLQRAIAAPG